MKNLPRYTIAAILIIIPCILLMKGIYGSFLFCFSIPLLWQIAYLGKPVSSLGLRMKSLIACVIIGGLSGMFLGLIGVKLLQLLGLTNYSLADSQSIGFGIGALKIEFSLAKELGYQLLSKSNSFSGLLLYVLFSILVIGLGEEIFWRGFIQGKIAKRTTKSGAILITAILFSLIHFYIFIIIPVDKSIILLMLIGVAGVAWGYIYEKTENIWSVAISHGIAAAIIWKHFFALPLTAG